MHYLNNNNILISINSVFDNKVFCKLFCNQLMPSLCDVTDMNAVGNCYRSQGNYDEAISLHEKARKLHLKQDCSPDRDKGVAIS